MVKAPKCKICGVEHWSYQEHEFGKGSSRSAMDAIAPFVRPAAAPLPPLPPAADEGEFIVAGETVAVAATPRRSRKKVVVDQKPAAAGKKGGRPSTTGKPWVAEGISRTEWYRRQKQKGGA